MLGRLLVRRELSEVTVRARIITSATGRFPVGLGCAATRERDPLDRERAAAKYPAGRSLGGAIHRGHWQSGDGYQKNEWRSMSCGAAHKADWIEPRAVRRLAFRARPDQVQPLDVRADALTSGAV